MSFISLHWLASAVACALYVGLVLTPVGELRAQPATMSVNGMQLQLASCAQREILWIEPYQVSLYLQQQRLDVPYILDAGTPKIVRILVTYDGRVPDDIPEAWQQRLKQDVEREIQNIYAGLNSGDAVVLAYRPGQGTTVLVNGRVEKTTASDEIVRGFLSALLGDNPASPNVKRLLLTPGHC